MTASLPWKTGLLHAGLLAAAVVLESACAVAPDHFYTLDTSPGGAAPPSARMTHVRLDVTVPSMVDRSEMVLNTSATGISILEHERWAAPLSDEVAQTLAADIERRRGDLLIGDARFDQPSMPPVSIKVDIVAMTAHRGGAVSIVAHWRIVDAAAGLDRLASDGFTAPIDGDGFAALAQAYSQVLGALAEKLAAAVP